MIKPPDFQTTILKAGEFYIFFIENQCYRGKSVAAIRFFVGKSVVAIHFFVCKLGLAMFCRNFREKRKIHRFIEVFGC
jgi:hypothetical protein